MKPFLKEITLFPISLSNKGIDQGSTAIPMCNWVQFRGMGLLMNEQSNRLISNYRLMILLILRKEKHRSTMRFYPKKEYHLLVARFQLKRNRMNRRKRKVALEPLITSRQKFSKVRLTHSGLTFGHSESSCLSSLQVLFPSMTKPRLRSSRISWLGKSNILLSAMRMGRSPLKPINS